MKVAHILRKYQPSEWGGTETALYHLLEGLKNQSKGKGNISSITYCPRLSSHSNNDPLSEAQHPVKRFRAFLPVIGISKEERCRLLSLGGNIISLDLLWSLWREPSLSLVHCHTQGRLAGTALTIARLRRLPFVISLHGGTLDMTQPTKNVFQESLQGWDFGKPFGWAFRSRKVISQADAVLAFNTTEMRLLQKQYPHTRIIHQPHGIPIAPFQSPCREEALHHFPQIRGKKILLFLGRIDPIKNQQWVLERMPELLKKHPDILLVIAGSTTDKSYEKDLKNTTISRLDIQKAVLFTGGLPPRDPRLIGLLQLSAMTVLASLSEPFGLTILETWAAHSVPIASRTSGATDLISHGENGFLFDLQHPQSFYEAANALLERPHLAQTLAEAGFQRVRQQYSHDRVSRRMCQLYEELTL